MTKFGYTYQLPNSVVFLDDQHYEIMCNPPAGCSFVRWEVAGGNIIVRDPKAQTAMVRVDSAGNLRAVYSAGCCRVGGVIAPTNALITIAPYLALISLVATTGVAATVKRKHKA